MNSHADNRSANVSIRENQKKHKANAKKSKELGSKVSLASSRPSKPRTCLRWIPTRRIFAMCGKLTASSNTENKSEKSVCDNASTSNPSEPSSKRFLISTSLLGRKKQEHNKKVLKTSKRRSVFKQRRKTVKSSKGAPTVPANTEWDDLDMDIDDTIDYTLAQDKGKTDKVDEKGENTAHQQSTDRQDGYCITM
ncbi:hypothetical protein Tco_0154670 [Tanacetum coccineum]